jgi:hypothetical protein
MKCKRFKTDRLRNEEWFQFFTEVKALIEKHNPGALNIDVLFAAFIILYAAADEAMEIIRKSANTELIAAADQARDMTFRGFAEAVKSASKHFDHVKREAARRLSIVFDHYADTPRKAYDAETAAIHNFLQEMNGANANDVAILGLNDWVRQLNTENDAFDTLQKARYDEITEKTSFRMQEVRKDTDRNYRDMLNHIDASILLNGESRYAPFVNALNVRVEHYRNIIAQRRGRKKEKES